MPKIDINQVAEIMKRNAVDPELLRQIVAEMQAATQPEAEEDKPPPVKKQWCILISDPDGRLPANSEFVGWVLQIPEHDSPATTLERIYRAAYDRMDALLGYLTENCCQGAECLAQAATHCNC